MCNLTVHLFYTKLVVVQLNKLFPERLSLMSKMKSQILETVSETFDFSEILPIELVSSYIKSTWITLPRADSVRFFITEKIKEKEGGTFYKVFYVSILNKFIIVFILINIFLATDMVIFVFFIFPIQLLSEYFKVQMYRVSRQKIKKII